MYDAAYIALAEALDRTPLTGDRRSHAPSGPTCQFEVLRPCGEPSTCRLRHSEPGPRKVLCA